MFLLLRYAYKKLFAKEKERNICILGLNGAGKSSLLNDIKWKFNEPSYRQPDEMIPTTGLNHLKLHAQKMTWTLWDLGGLKKYRGAWKSYYSDTDILIWVIDSSDNTTLEESIEELKKLISDPDLKFCPVILMANKQDLHGALNKEEIIQRFQLEEVNDRKWAVIPSSFVGDFENHSGLNDVLSGVNDILLNDPRSKERTIWKKEKQNEETV